MWPFKRKDKNESATKGALLGALLAFQGSPVLHLREDALPQFLSALSVEPDEAGSDVVFVGSRPVPVAYWGGEGTDEETPYTITTEGVAIIPVCGMLLNQEPEYWFRWYGYCSTPMIGRMVDMAASDARVSSILLYISSPGGHSAGISEVAAKIWQVRQDGEKRILGVGVDICSAAYHLGSQCEELYISKSGFSGCIGTLMTPADWSEAYAQFGIKRLRITSDGGEKLKGAGTQGTKITPEQEADWKRLCNEIQALFSGDVMRARGFDEKAMLTLSTGQYWTGAVGVDKKLVDGVASAADVLAALGSGGEVVCEGGTPPKADPDNDEDGASELRNDATENSRGNNPQTEETMDEKTQKGLVAAFVSEIKTLFASNKPDPAQTELEKLKAENAKREEDALKSAREAATAAATAAYGPGTPELASAVAAIDATENTSVLGALESAYKAKVSATAPPARQTTGSNTTPPAAPTAPQAEKTALESKDYEDIYSAYNAPKAGAFGQKGGH